MKEVKLRMNKKTKYDHIKELVDYDGNKKRVTLKLGISEKQVKRLIIKYKENDKSSFVHGNRGQKPTKAINSPLFT